MTKHIHAELMAQYAQDALRTDKPWEIWETFDTIKGKWCTLETNPMWCPYSNYRRKPEPDRAKIYTHKFTRLYGEEVEVVDSILNASHISIYKADERGFESWVYDVELPETLLAIFNVHQTAVELYDQL